LIWILVALAAIAVVFFWLRKKRERGTGVAKSIAASLAMQAMLFPYKLGSPPCGKIADRFSVGYVFGFSVLLLVASGRKVSSLQPILFEIFEILFGDAGRQMILEHDRAMKSGTPEAATGAAAGREDAKRYLESGGQREVSGWIQYVRSDLFDGAAATSST
jgi:hypothetical protein